MLCECDLKENEFGGGCLFCNSLGCGEWWFRGGVFVVWSGKFEECGGKFLGCLWFVFFGD